MTATDNDRSPEVLGVGVGMTALAGLFVFARVIIRTIIRPNFWWDDTLIIITWLLTLGCAMATVVAVGYGYGKHLAELPVPDAILTARALTVAQFLAILPYPTGKASIACLLIRIFPDRTLKWILWTFVAANVIFFYLNSIFVLARCHPVQYTWDLSVPGGSCWEPTLMRVWSYTTGILGAVTDFVFATLPWYYIRRLQMNRKEKIGVGTALSIGLIATTCSVFKIILTSNFWALKDTTYDTIPLWLFGFSEINLTTVAACIPTLRPLYWWLSGKTPREAVMRSLAKPSTTYPTNRNRDASKYFRGISPRVNIGPSVMSDPNIYHTTSFEVRHEHVDMEQSQKQGRESADFLFFEPSESHV